MKISRRRLQSPAGGPSAGRRCRHAFEPDDRKGMAVSSPTKAVGRRNTEAVAKAVEGQ